MVPAASSAPQADSPPRATPPSASPYVNRTTGDLRLKSGSGCGSLVHDVASIVDGATPDLPAVPVSEAVGSQPEPAAPASPAPASRPATAPAAARRASARPRKRRGRRARAVVLTVVRASRRRARPARRLRISGRVKAAPARRRVLIQVRRNGRWRTIVVTHSRGTALNATIALRGTARLRAVVPGVGVSAVTRVRA